jgi:hypothetical protein
VNFFLDIRILNRTRDKRDMRHALQAAQCGSTCIVLPMVLSYCTRAFASLEFESLCADCSESCDASFSGLLVSPFAGFAACTQKTKLCVIRRDTGTSIG